MYGNREEQGQLLQQVLTASDTDADEERIPNEGPRPVSVIYKCRIETRNFFKIIKLETYIYIVEKHFTYVCTCILK